MVARFHPRSRLTTSLFGTTLLACFAVVGLPHLIPCPAPRRAYADGEMPDERSQRRRRKALNQSNSPGSSEELSAEGVETLRQRKKSRECPVPKPGGLVGTVLGFRHEDEPITERLPVVISSTRPAGDGRESESP
jgi:cytochrome c oxidase assembly factor 2